MAAARASDKEPWLDSLRVPNQHYSVETICKLTGRLTRIDSNRNFSQELEDSQPPFVVLLSHQLVAAPLQRQIDHRMSVAGLFHVL